MPATYQDNIFLQEMRKLGLSRAYSTTKNKLPLKKFVQQAYGRKKIPFSLELRLTLRDAALSKKAVEITYRKITTAELKRYIIEPYSYRYLRLKVGIRKMLFGWDMKEKKIKSFSLSNITEIKPTEKKFSPKFPIEIGRFISQTKTVIR
ncbi:MAG: WYL domain-containing protein [Candidatus Omnitrophica bacterium]|nr:WYL domain-containing protein [Candidatus Omnitrophota bacterium]